MTLSPLLIDTSEPQTVGEITLRNFNWDDFDVLVELLHVGKREQFGESSLSVEEVRGEYTQPEFDATRNLRVGYAPDGRMVAVSEYWTIVDPPVRPYFWAYVHPEFRNLGLGTAMLDWAKARTIEELHRVPDGARVCLTASISLMKSGSIELMESTGFRQYTTFYTMKIELEALPDAPVWPDGVTIHDLTEFEGDITEFIRVKHTAFLDHRNAVEEPFEEELARWQHEAVHNTPYRPQLWLMAKHNGEPAAIVICSTESSLHSDMAWVMDVGVLPKFRRQGLAHGLLIEGFRRLFAEGFRKVGLNVDGNSLTNAVALYERAGMHVHYRWPSYELELRPGVELTPQ